ncbi:MAG TPA: hypothetical protein GX505_11080 [Clostridiales bacterium]|nr:hypothetical protein [Clostridiales bacterium]
MQMVTTFSGILNLVYMLADAKEEIEDLLTIMEEKYDIAAQLTIDSPAECIMIPENLSSEVVGLKYYDKNLKVTRNKRPVSVPQGLSQNNILFGAVLFFTGFCCFINKNNALQAKNLVIGNNHNHLPPARSLLFI